MGLLGSLPPSRLPQHGLVKAHGRWLGDSLFWDGVYVKVEWKGEKPSLKEGDLLVCEGEVVGGVLECTHVSWLRHVHRPYRSFGDPQFLKQWESFVSHVRCFFKSKEFLEVRTPTLVPCPGMEPHLLPFETTWVLGQQKKTFFLPTSPEFHLKKLLSSGVDRLFEFKDSFRNGELGEHHQPEFLMLEWYRSFSGIEAIQEDLKDLISSLSKTFLKKELKIECTTMEELFQNHLDFLLRVSTSQEELMALAHRVGLGDSLSAQDTWDDVFFKIFINKIEPQFKNRALLVAKFPPSQAALATLTEDGWAHRFEFYWNGLEIANAYNELTDAQEQRLRFQKDQKLQKELGRAPLDIDEELLEALEIGLPPCGGIALGMERLYMALFSVKRIQEVRAFALSDRS